jgi:hypothetical protein
MKPDELAALVAWPKRLERLAMNTNPKQMTTTSVYESSLKHILDAQKDSLTHLRIEGEYEPGLPGFDLRTFSRLEHLALCTTALSHCEQPELIEHIFAPRLRSLLWVQPWWLTGEPMPSYNFFTSKEDER